MPTLPIPVFVSLVLGYACLRLWQEQKRLSLLGSLLLLCAAQSAVIALAQHYGVAGVRRLQPLTATLIAPLAWLAFQGTAVRRLDRRDLLHGLAPLATLAAIVFAPRFNDLLTSRLIDLLVPAVFVGYGIAILAQTRQGGDAQPHVLLAHGNVPASIWLVIGLALIASALSDVLISVAQMKGLPQLRPWIVTVFSVGNLALIGLFSLSPYLRTEPPAPTGPAGADAEPDAELWGRVGAYMERERPYLDPDLTLAQLARKLRVPAKALSITINRATGENVSRFVNEARIRAAQAAMRDGKSITEAMFSSGFNTKSNFNREFLRVAAASPSDWLRAQSAPDGGDP